MIMNAKERLGKCIEKATLPAPFSFVHGLVSHRVAFVPSIQCRDEEIPLQ
jgi:hypothetical protein